ncbi:sigma 54-interacting transcriptional regulator [Geothrix sp.]|uniref:sigma-54 interaction domain-containing protein n=1 Tax=Geothrix sp. TaxID=1962974 RepID=UPI0025C40A14|nr:sigma 54-interacting transcriptional regulator [Geothrix sp.]WIL21101.1 MAG: sigma 54-interacting transcriptional regulator [Geothrix sp.]
MTAILDTTPNAVFILTHEGITRCNKAAVRMLGVASLNELRSRYGRRGEGFLLRWPKNLLPLREEEHPLTRAFKGEKVTEVVLAIHAGTGEEITLKVTAAPIVVKGKIIGAVAIHSDITWGKRACPYSPALDTGEDLLTHEKALRRQAENDLHKANAEIQALKDRIQSADIYPFQEVNHTYHFGEVIGQSRCLENVFFRVEAVAPQDSTVLLLGETGTGKGLVARAIHSRSLRKNRPLVMVNCTALPASLIESELFGREKGAFTGASAQQLGRFEMADKGTILLDEIGDLPFELQAKLLHVIQDGEFSRLGSSRTVKVDVRIIAATNRDLYEEMRLGRFREDLFYRLNIFPITIPPLRDRSEDIPLLVEYFLEKFNRKVGKNLRNVTNETMDRLMAHSWPGNVRELESVIERAAIVSQGATLQVLDRFSAAGPAHPQDETKPLVDLERDYISQVLRKTNWRIEGANGAAHILGINPSTLRGRMRKEGIRRP